MERTENGHPTVDAEPTEAMLLAGAKAAVDQIYHKGNVWERGYIHDPQDWLNAMRHGWKAMEALRGQ
jgi:hypothetical protein